MENKGGGCRRHRALRTAAPRAVCPRNVARLFRPKGRNCTARTSSGRATVRLRRREARNAPKAWNGPKRRVPKAPSREHAPAGQRNGEARDGLKGRGGPTKVATAFRLLTIKMIFGKDGGIMMAMFFAQRVILGKTTFANVPKALKAGVAEVLIDSGLPELVPTEYGGTADGE